MDPNTSYPFETNDPLFYLCWRRQSCGWCLQGDAPCSWCSVTSTCVPNPSRFPILAPISSSKICPLGSKERWELRAVPFGCNISTFTFLTAVTSILGTLVTIALGIFSLWTVKRLQHSWGQGKLGGEYTSWSACLGHGDVRRRAVGDVEGNRNGNSERTPLLDGD
ncbi:uncharacterized protein BDW43DRAFT_140572 [Aspergillus alliaceus]|uniref:uncharacterized protein n=1 Tax=Petromyces alliaceus TaxID=209559 RepID=UPI0012A65D1D|nr:uncharacterized protein BDW43DRAFT_140572 [Aspergillus alliaceus]KAB8231558.1 hypothetical protein BDW43DRAFT_140572 [Aspergillus alliaceus]